MGEYSAWEMWIVNNMVVVILFVTLGFGAFLWIGNRLLTKHVELDELKEKFHEQMASQKREIEKSELGRVADKIEDLVSQIQYLFQKQDVTITSIENLGGRVTTLEKKVEAHTAKCNEREKTLIAKFGSF